MGDGYVNDFEESDSSYINDQFEHFEDDSDLEMKMINNIKLNDAAYPKEKLRHGNLPNDLQMDKYKINLGNLSSTSKINNIINYAEQIGEFSSVTLHTEPLVKKKLKCKQTKSKKTKPLKEANSSLTSDKGSYNNTKLAVEKIATKQRPLLFIQPNERKQIANKNFEKILVKSELDEKIILSKANHHVNQQQHYSTAILQRQLNTALSRCNMYRKENELLLQKLDVAGIEEAIEKYKNLLWDKENRICELESENQGLRSISRYQSKQLSNSQRARDEQPATALNQDKQMEVLMLHIKKLKENIAVLKNKEHVLVNENEIIKEKNSKLQRKLNKCKLQLQENKEANEKAANSSISTDAIRCQNDNNNNDSNTSNNIFSSAIYKTNSNDSTAVIGCSTNMSLDGYSSCFISNILPGNGRRTARSAAYNMIDGNSGRRRLSNSRASSDSAATSSAVDISTRLAESQAIVVRQASKIERLEKNLATQRARYLNDIARCKAQTDLAISQQKILEVELEKRERFEKLQMGALKHLRSTYEDLLEAHQKLQPMSELCIRDVVATAAIVKEVVVAVPKLSPRAALISNDDDDCNNNNNNRNTIHSSNNRRPYQPLLPKQPNSSRGSSRRKTTSSSVNNNTNSNALTGYDETKDNTFITNSIEAEITKSI